MLHQFKRGFTLVEIIIVISIIGILLAIAFPKFSDAMKNADNIKIESNAKAIAGAITSVMAKNMHKEVINSPSVLYQGVNVIETAGLKPPESEYYKIEVTEKCKIIVIYSNDSKRYSGSKGTIDKPSDTSDGTKLTEEQRQSGVEIAFFSF